jgi:ABC-type phosphate transport system substrate-binding protein
MLGFGKKKSPRAGLRAALLAGATVAALGLGGLGAPGASASLNCGGSAITGQGSSLQKVAQQNVWSPGFSGVSGVCPSGPTVTYNSTGSGGGLKEWNHDGIKGFINTGLSFIGTDDPPTPAQVTNIDGVADGAHVVVIPVAQTSISIIANLPANCSFAEETGITNLDLQKVFRGSLKTWSGLETTEGSGCNSPITRVVRKDGSGTTYQFKTYLARMNGGSLPCVNKSWLELRPISGPEPTPNQTWPETCTGNNLSAVVKPPANGGGEVVKKTNEVDGAIGYAATPDVKTSAFNANLTSAALQNNGKVAAGSGFFATPETGTSANCTSTPYYVPSDARPGAGDGIGVDWSTIFGVYPNIQGSGYPLCTLTFVLAFHGMSLVQAGGSPPEGPFTEGQYTTTNDYLREYIVQAAGQEDIDSNYYAPLPESGQGWHDVLGAARFAASKISW